VLQHPVTVILKRFPAESPKTFPHLQRSFKRSADVDALIHVAEKLGLVTSSPRVGKLSLMESQMDRRAFLMSGWTTIPGTGIAATPELSHAQDRDSAIHHVEVPGHEPSRGRPGLPLSNRLAVARDRAARTIMQHERDAGFDCTGSPMAKLSYKQLGLHRDESAVATPALPTLLLSWAQRICRPSEPPGEIVARLACRTINLATGGQPPFRQVIGN
jgi:hypothetical protein